jgi:CheY-like chemotaxis protein
MNMPELDGLGLARILREKGKSVPIVILTARCDQEGLNQQMQAYGVIVYPKPFVPSKLVQEVDRMLGAVTE